MIDKSKEKNEIVSYKNTHYNVFDDRCTTTNLKSKR